MGKNAKIWKACHRWLKFLRWPWNKIYHHQIFELLFICCLCRSDWMIQSTHTNTQIRKPKDSRKCKNWISVNNSTKKKWNRFWFTMMVRDDVNNLLLLVATEKNNNRKRTLTFFCIYVEVVHVSKAFFFLFKFG